MIDRDVTPPDNRLTPRQLEVLRWTANGNTASEIAEILGISTRTVHFHASEAMYRLSCRSKLQAVLKAVELGLLEPGRGREGPPLARGDT